MDDEIIYSWCFNSVKCFDSASSAASIILVENLESLSSLISQHLQPTKTCQKGIKGVNGTIYGEIYLIFNLFFPTSMPNNFKFRYLHLHFWSIYSLTFFKLIFF